MAHDPDAFKENNKPETGGRLGVYKHENTGEELWAQEFPHADALVRQGWTWDRPLPSAETRRELTKSVQSDPTASAEELKALREENAQLKANAATADAKALEEVAAEEKRKSLPGKTKAQLIALAEEEGITTEDGATNAQISDAIQAKRDEKGNE